MDQINKEHMNVQKANFMDKSEGETQDLLKRHLKAVLFQLASKSENPSYDLQIILREVLEELHQEVQETIKKKPHLHLVAFGDS
jgi:hypothetical protein